MRLAVQACTRRSRSHSHNEDRAAVGDDVLASTAGVERHWLETPAMVAAFDGVGGGPAGAVASDLAARTLSAADVPRDEATATTLLARADQILLDAGEVDLTRKGMATTATALIVVESGDRAVVANVGDTLVARLQIDNLEELSVSDRLAGGIFQALGGRHDSAMRPHVSTLEIEVGDRLLLATDGLTDVVSDGALEGVLRHDHDDPVAQLLDLVERADTPDDVTIIVVDVVDG